jgi:hypothetical protein
MTLLGALMHFCTTVETALGPMLSELIGIAGIAAFTWWRAKKAISKVEAKADAGIAAANERASVAKAEARGTKVQLARIEGSLRPASLATPLLPSVGPTPGTSSSSSGHFEPVVFPELPQGAPGARPAMPDPSINGDHPLPAPSRVPRDIHATPPERPSGKS